MLERESVTVYGFFDDSVNGNILLSGKRFELVMLNALEDQGGKVEDLLFAPGRDVTIRLPAPLAAWIEAGQSLD